MTHQTRPGAGSQESLRGPDSWTRARLVEPSTAGFVHIGVSSGRWRLPVALPRARRRAVLVRLHSVAAVLRRDPRVVRADVFEALLRPPGGGGIGQDPASGAVDAVLLVETAAVADADELLVGDLLHRLEADLQTEAAGTLVFSGSNPRRMGPVDHDRQGVFLFNYFSGEDVGRTLFAWQYTAGWFQDQTGLDNSTVLQPRDPDAVPYTLVNHCRWDHLRDIVPALVFKRSFRDFVLGVFADNGVVPHPVLYRLSR